MRHRFTHAADAPPLLRYGAALLASTLALLLTWLFLPLTEQNLFLLFFAAVAFSAWYGGLGPGLSVIVFTVLTIGYMFMPPNFSLEIGMIGFLRLSGFTFVALLIILLTERSRRAEAAAHEQGERFHVTLASIGDGVIVTDTAGCVTFMNPVAEALTGWTLAEAGGRPITDVFRIVNEHTRAPVENPSTTVLREGIVVGLANHTILLARDGSERPIDDSGAPIRDAHGAIVGVVLVFHDISERKRAEQARQVLIDAGAALAGGLDEQERLDALARLVVPHLADWCGIDIVAEDGTIEQVALVHRDPARIAWARDQRRRVPRDPQAPQGFHKVIRTGEPEFYPQISEALLANAGSPAEGELVRNLGVTSAMIVPLAARGYTFGAITLLATESRRHYDQADLALVMELARRAALAVDNARLYAAEQQARARAEAAVRARDQFLSVAAHELRTPLTSLLGYTQLLQRHAERDGTLPERDQRAIGVIVGQTARLNRMVMALLDIARLETGQLSIERGWLDLCALARRVAEEVQPTLSIHTVECVTPDGPLVVEGDELRLEQVLQNLVQNAIKYSPSGGPVTIRVEQRGEQICVAVSDRGIGIPSGALSRLFQRFYRAHNVEREQIGGMGIGLYVVKEIVALHGGSVTVKSVEGEGSTFTVCLPRTHKVPEKRADDLQNREPGTTQRVPDQEPPRGYPTRNHPEGTRPGTDNQELRMAVSIYPKSDPASSILHPRSSLHVRSVWQPYNRPQSKPRLS